VDEVPMLVEFMLHKVMEEFEHHLLTQRKQVTKMKSTLRELLLRQEKLVSQNMVLEALAAGSQEEVKLITKKLQLGKVGASILTWNWSTMSFLGWVIR
jgi:hypothetical protein